eukprot:225096_1
MTESGEEYIPVNLSTKEDVVRDDVDSPSWTKFFEIQTHDFQSVFSVRFDPDSRFLATTSSDAKVRIYDMADGTLKTTITTPGHGRLEPFPVTCVRWSPSKYENDRATGPGPFRRLLVCRPEGFVEQYEDRGQFYVLLSEVEEEGNQVYCAGYSSDGTHYVTGGRDGILRVYDYTNKVVNKFENSLHPHASARMSNVQFVPGSSNLLVSASWDRNLRIWDMRQDGVVRQWLCPHVTGVDGVDVDPYFGGSGAVVTAGHVPTENLTVWDLGSGRVVQDIKWDSVGDTTPSLLNVAMFSANRSTLFAGGINEKNPNGNRLKAFHKKGETFEYFAEIAIPRGAFAAHCSPDGQSFAVATMGSEGPTVLCYNFTSQDL